MVLFACITLAALGVIASLIPTLHLSASNIYLLALAAVVHTMTASACYLIDSCLYGKMSYRPASFGMILLFAGCIWMAFQLGNSHPGTPMQFMFLIGASGFLNGLGILVFRLHVPAHKTSGDKNTTIRAA
jgi:hypothetical protein